MSAVLWAGFTKHHEPDSRWAPDSWLRTPDFCLAANEAGMLLMLNDLREYVGNSFGRFAKHQERRLERASDSWLSGWRGAKSGKPLPPGIAPKCKTNPRSALESTKVSKNEPETNPNEPELTVP
jgi:hypothetical protein